MAIGTIALLVFLTSTPRKDHTQEYAKQDEEKAKLVARLNAQYGSVTRHYRTRETGRPYTIIFKGFDPIVLRMANPSVVGGGRISNTYHTMIQFNSYYFNLATGDYEGNDGFEAESVTSDTMILQRIKPYF